MTLFHFCVLFVSVCVWFPAKLPGVRASCNPNPCMNGGVCHFLPNTSSEFCLCPYNFTGSQFCHPSSAQASTVTLESSVTTSSQSTTDRLNVQKASTLSSHHVISESGSSRGDTSTLQPTTNVRQQTTSSIRSTSDEHTTTVRTTKRMTRARSTAEDTDLKHSSTQSSSDIASSVIRIKTIPGTTKKKSVVGPTKETETLIPTKSTKKQGRNYSLWFTWIVVLLFVTSVLLLILAIALFISYGRVGSYNQDEERDSQDYPPEEDDLSGRKQVFNLKFT